MRSSVERTGARFKISVAEVDGNDVITRGVIGVAVIANDSSLVNSVLDKVEDFVVSQTAGVAEVVDTRMELMHW